MAPSDTAALQELAKAVASGQQLCEKLAAALDETCKDRCSALKEATEKEPPFTSTQLPTASKQVNAVSLAHDAITLIRAHATKLSLLAVNEPFTPSVIADVLRQLLDGPVPAAAAAAQTCDPALHTVIFRKELFYRLRRVFVALGNLIGTIIPTADKTTLPASRQGAATSGGKASSCLPATGILWSACDQVLALIKKGISGFLLEKMDEWRDTLVDVMHELKDWGEETEDEKQNFDEDNDNQAQDDGQDNLDAAVSHDVDADADPQEKIHNNATAAQDIVDQLMNEGQAAIPANDPQGIRPRLGWTLRRMRFILSLYQAIKKRRLETLPPMPILPSSPDHTQQQQHSNQIPLPPQRLDMAMAALGRLPDTFGHLALSFYDMDPLAIDGAADDCFLAAFSAGELLSPSWDGGQDEFSKWLQRLKTELKLR